MIQAGLHGGYSPSSSSSSSRNLSQQQGGGLKGEVCWSGLEGWGKGGRVSGLTGQGESQSGQEEGQSCVNLKQMVI